MATVTHVELPDGSHAIGVGSGDEFVPFVTLDAARFEQLRSNEFYTAPSGKGSKGKTNDENPEGGDK